MREELYRALMDEHCPSLYFHKLRSEGSLAELYPEAATLVGVRQDPQHHPEGDVYTHTMMVVDYAAGIRNQAEYPLPFMLSALCHDFGKPVTTTVDENGKIHAYGHDESGVEVACRFLQRLGADAETEIYVANMVSLHMLPARKAKHGSSVKSTNHMFDKSVSPHDLLLLSEADQMGRGGAVIDEGRQEWLRDRLSAYDEIMARPYVSRGMLENQGTGMSGRWMKCSACLISSSLPAFTQRMHCSRCWESGEKWRGNTVRFQQAAMFVYKRISDTGKITPAYNYRRIIINDFLRILHSRKVCKYSRLTHLP